MYNAKPLMCSVMFAAVFQDPRNGCRPVDCVEKYSGWRNFFRAKTGKCEVIHECYTKGKKDELPEIVSIS